MDVLAANNTLSEEAYEQLKVSLGLDKPVLVRYGIWLGDFFQGDMGVSTRTNTPVSKVIGERVGASLLLSVSGLVFCLLTVYRSESYPLIRRGVSGTSWAR